MPQDGNMDYRQQGQGSGPRRAQPRVSQEMPEAAIEGRSPFQQQYPEAMRPRQQRRQPQGQPQGQAHGQQQGQPYGAGMPQPGPHEMVPMPQQPAPAPGPDRRHRKPGRLMRFLRRLLILLMLVACLVGGFVGGVAWERRAHPVVSAASIATQLADCSDLATVTLMYNGFVHFEEGNIPIINLKSFNMTYSAEVRAGVDLSQAKVSVEGQTIKVTLPKAAIQTVAVDPASIQFFDQTWSLLNWDSKQDTATALDQAQLDLEAKVDEIEMLDEAEENAEQVIKSLLEPIVKSNDAYRLVVETEA